MVGDVGNEDLSRSAPSFDFSFKLDLEKCHIFGLTEYELDRIGLAHFNDGVYFGQKIKDQRDPQKSKKTV